jgi:uncharacterized membrane protein YgaE (UPF0421/DUF939 family)
MQVSLRAAVAAGLSVAIAQRLNMTYPVVALASSVIVTDVEPSRTRHLGLQRLLGTVLAGFVGILIGPGGSMSIAVAIASAMLLANIVGLGSTAKLAGFVCGIVVLAPGGAPVPYALQRVYETVIGILMAVLVSFVPRLIRLEGSPSKEVDLG